MSIKRLTLTLFIALVAAVPLAQSESQLRFCVRSEPKTFNPLLVEEDSSDTIRYLTGGVLVRLNRQTQRLEPGLATAWKLSKDGRTITFTLRPGVRFSDGTPFSAEDVAYTVDQMMDPKLHSPVGDTFRSGEGKTETRILGPNKIAITFPAPVAGIDKLFDQVAIMSAKSPKKEMAVLGPYYVNEIKAGSYLLLRRNSNYWKHDGSGRQLPYIDSVRLDIQQNRDLELLRLLRGEIDFVNSIDSEYYDKLASERPGAAYDAGESLDSEQMWFNQVPSAPLPEYKKAWFRSTNFRRAISEAINREDLARIAFRGHARPAVGMVSPANQFWFNSKLKPHPFDQQSAMKRLAEDGFRRQNDELLDRDGHRVEFSIITNAGNKYRERMATMIQQDLAGIGVKVNVVTLDFPSLIERITRNFNYEAALLGLVNTDLDPAPVMNVWLSSGENHQWNPNQKTPATAWEAEIDRLMRAQASTLDDHKRKKYFDRVQEIAWEQEPFIYLVTKNSLSAVSAIVQNVHPVVLRPQVFWNVDELSLAPQMATK
ncbi:MAG TPA: ABC transporter substrate-binding protein [Terriglobales bacterium]|nr:ABC transporter substrate-binding protein [Terriglobales bacterium]